MKYETCFISEEVRKEGKHTTLLIPDAEKRIQFKKWGLEGDKK
jgi:hypothetical protein